MSVRVLSQLVTTKVEADPSVAFLAIAGWLYWRYRKRKEKEARLKAAKAASADRQPTEAEKKATAMEDARTGMMAWLFGFRSQLKA